MCGPTTKRSLSKECWRSEWEGDETLWKERERNEEVKPSAPNEKERGNKQECKHHPEAGKGQETNSSLDSE